MHEGESLIDSGGKLDCMGLLKRARKRRKEMFANWKSPKGEKNAEESSVPDHLFTARCYPVRERIAAVANLAGCYRPSPLLWVAVVDGRPLQEVVD